MKNVIVTQGERVSRVPSTPLISGALLLLAVVSAACGGSIASPIVDSEGSKSPPSSSSSSGSSSGAKGGGANAGSNANGGPTENGGDNGSDPNDPMAGPSTPEPAIACKDGSAGGVNPTGQGCRVSFTKDLLEKRMGAAGTWGCAVSGGCHAPEDGVLPKLDVTNAAISYANLYASGTYAPYINPCSFDVNASEIIPNLSGETAGAHMPLGNPEIPSADDIALVRSWVECGAPLN